jgi:hypothetical protein
MSGESREARRAVSTPSTNVRSSDRPLPVKRIARTPKKVLHQDVFYVDFPNDLYDQ